ncbi:MAG: hypothetical protein KDE08_06835 [Rhodobacteraceae bacterium]|nr:hypothetical protein [Paracoccaceae bacterium]
MEFIADVLLGAGALGAGAYCWVLGRRLKAFNQLENGMGGAVAALSAQVDDLTRILDAARKTAAHSSDSLTKTTARAEAAAGKLELMLATMHDLPEPGATAGGRLKVVRRHVSADRQEETE